MYVIRFFCHVFLCNTPVYPPNTLSKVHRNASAYAISVTIVLFTRTWSGLVSAHQSIFFWRIWRMKISELRPAERWEEWFMHWYMYPCLFWIYLIKLQLMCERLGLCRYRRSLMLPIRCSWSMSFNFHKNCGLDSRITPWLELSLTFCVVPLHVVLHNVIDMCCSIGCSWIL